MKYNLQLGCCLFTLLHLSHVIFPLLILQITSFQFHHFAVLHPLYSPVVVIPMSLFMYLHARQVVRNNFGTR